VSTAAQNVALGQETEVGLLLLSIVAEVFQTGVVAARAGVACIRVKGARAAVARIRAAVRLSGIERYLNMFIFIFSFVLYSI
jgi:hypothetical protein